MNRRGFLLGLGASAPAFIAASNLMKVAALRESVTPELIPPGVYEAKIDHAIFIGSTVRIKWYIRDEKTGQWKTRTETYV